MEISVKYEGDLSELSRRHSNFAMLHNAKITKSEKRRWSRNGGSSLSHDIQIVFIGKSGYGKSSTVNAFFGQSIMGTSDMQACTRDIQSFEFKIKDGHFFSFADLPGIGESKSRDEEYLTLYSKIIKKADAIIYLIRADSRDFAIDVIAFKKLFSTPELSARVILALNCCDKIEPINRKLPFTPTTEQLQNIKQKIKSVRKIFNAQNKIVPYSATTEWNLTGLAEEMLRVVLLSNDIKAVETSTTLIKQEIHDLNMITPHFRVPFAEFLKSKDENKIPGNDGTKSNAEKARDACAAAISCLQKSMVMSKKP